MCIRDSYYDSFSDRIYSFEDVPVGFDGLIARSVYTLEGKDSGLLSITCGDTDLSLIHISPWHR